MAVISLKLGEALDAHCAKQADHRQLSKSELIQRSLTAFLQSAVETAGGAARSTGDFLADLAGCCEDTAAELSSAPSSLLALWQANYDDSA